VGGAPRCLVCPSKRRGKTRVWPRRTGRAAARRAAPLGKAAGVAPRVVGQTDTSGGRRGVCSGRPGAMSVDYLRAFVDVCESCPNDIQPDMTELKQEMDKCEDLLISLKDEQTRLITDTGEINAGSLIDYHGVIKELVSVVRQKEAYCKRIAATVEESKKMLDVEKADWISGAYEKRDLLPPEPEPEPEPVQRKPAPTYNRPPSNSSSSSSSNNAKKNKAQSSDNNKRKRPVEQPTSKVPSKKPSQTKPPQKRPKPNPTSSGKGDSKPTARPASRPRYCRPECLAGDSGEMVACDTDSCPFGEWFHLGCVGLRVPPPEDKKWYCFECRRKRSA